MGNNPFQTSLLVVFLPFFLLISIPVHSQSHFRARFFDAENGLPVQQLEVIADSVSYLFQENAVDIFLPGLPGVLVVKASGYLPFRITSFPKKTNLTIYLIPEHVNVQEVTVKAFQSEKRLADTPGSISLIGNRQLLREPTFTLAPSINKIPGLWMQSGSINTNRLTIRGIGARSPYGSNKIRAYYGNIPLTNGVGETTLEDLDPEQIANIEIVKGPASGFYGSGLGGVLLIIPKEPTENFLSQRTSFGSFQTLKFTGEASFKGKNSGHSLVYSRFHSGGYRENNESDRHNLTFTSVYSRRNTRVDLLGAFVDMFAYIPSSIDLKTFETNPEKAAPSWAANRGFEDYSRFFGGASLSQTLNKTLKLQISTFAHFNKNYELRPFNILQEKNHYQGIRPTIEKTFGSRSADFKLVAGNEVFSEIYRWQTFQNLSRKAGNLLSDNKELRSYTNFFVLAEMNLAQKLLVSGSLNVNKTVYNYFDQFLTDGDQSGVRHFGSVVSPRLAVNWKASDAVSLYSVVSSGFSPPTLEETLLPNGARNAAIKPETGWNFEGGIKTPVTNSLYLELSVYYMRVKNLLVSRRTADDAFMGINAGSTSHPGMEAKLDYLLLRSNIWQIYIRSNAHLTRYRFASFFDNGKDYSGNKLTGTPGLTTNWMLEANLIGGLFVNLHFQTVGRIPITDSNAVYSQAYRLANFNAGYEHSFNNLSIGFSGGIQNIFNEHYASMLLINATASGAQLPRYFYPGLPRNYKASVFLKYTL